MELVETRPLYLQIKEDILRRLNAGEWTEGEFIPTETEFVDFYQVSRGTIRHALGELESDRLIDRYPGRGTIVAREPIKQEYLKLTSFSRDMRARGLEPKSITVDIDFQIPPKQVKDGLKLSNDEKVWRVKRLRLAGDEPVGVQYLFVPPELQISSKDIQDIQSYYDYLENVHHKKPIFAVESLTATVASENEAEILNVSKGEALILIWRTTYGLNRQPLEVVKILYLGKRYQYHLKLYSEIETDIIPTL